MRYIAPYDIYYHSERYGKNVTVFAGYESDGATGGIDVWSHAWWIHDVLCDRGSWDDGELVSNWQASTVLADVLRSEGRWLRAIYWRWATFLFGCKKCRENGMWTIKTK